MGHKRNPLRKRYVAFFYQIRMHNRKTGLNTHRTNCGVDKGRNFVGLYVGGMIGRNCVNRTVFDCRNNGINVFAGAQRRMHLCIGVVANTFFVGKREVLNGNVCRHGKNPVLFCVSDCRHGTFCRVVRQMHSCARAFCEQNVFHYRKIFRNFWDTRQTQLRRDPSFVHRAVFSKRFRLTVAHNKDVVRLRILHRPIQKPRVLDIFPIISHQHGARIFELPHFRKCSAFEFLCN